MIPAGEYKLQVKGAEFLVGEQKLKFSEIDPSIFALFLSTPTTNEVQQTGEDEVTVIYRPEPETSFTLSDVLLSTLYMQHQNDEDLNWDQVLRDGPFGSFGNEIRSIFPMGFEKGFIQYVLEQVPETAPAFLGD